MLNILETCKVKARFKLCRKFINDLTKNNSLGRMYTFLPKYLFGIYQIPIFQYLFFLSLELERVIAIIVMNLVTFWLPSSDCLTKYIGENYFSFRRTYRGEITFFPSLAHGILRVWEQLQI